MTETLSKASVDIFHFAVVFFTVFLIYTISGMLLFGQELLMFSTTERALDATFKIVMGDFDWEEMRRIGRLEAWIWFVTFMLLVNLIMLNMLIAIIMDVYAEVKSSLPADADTLWSQLYEVIDRKTAVYYYGTRVSLKSIHANLHLRDDDERQSKDEDSKEPHDLDIVRFIVMAPEDGDEFKEITFAFHFKADDGSVEFELDDFSGELYVKSVSDSGSSIAVRLMEDGTEYDRKSDEAIFQPCYESYQVIRVLWGPVQATDGQEMVDAIEAARAAKAPVRITIKKSGGEAIEGTHDIEGLTNTLRKIKVSSYQAKIVLEAALKHAEAGLTNGSSISENNNRIAKVSDTLWEVQVLARGNWDLVDRAAGAAPPGHPAAPPVVRAAPGGREDLDESHRESDDYEKEHVHWAMPRRAEHGCRLGACKASPPATASPARPLVGRCRGLQDAMADMDPALPPLSPPGRRSGRLSAEGAGARGGALLGGDWGHAMASSSSTAQLHADSEKKLSECLESLKGMTRVLQTLQQHKRSEAEARASGKEGRRDTKKKSAAGNSHTPLSMLKNEDRLEKIIRGKDPKNEAPSLNHVKRYVQTELEQAEACCALPYVMLLLAFFCAAAFSHLQPEVLHHVDRAFIWDLEENANFAFEGNTPFEDGRFGHKSIATSPPRTRGRG
ncbi:unnamed protein product [Prorocentrum cordatum]|uniref:Polycystin cation channel PKD1/PKD2 domain-containing protein n=1 Tax=Prorocentrum cordatum TaxID=2364126 RepID=A0ABN9X2Z3_9DINO|nr:unnamed protein product [Polarella glacialis]